MPHIPVSSYSKTHPEWTTSRSPVVDVDKFGKEAYTIGIFESEYRLDEKMAFCDAPDHSHTFQSAPIVKYTQDGPLPEAQWSVSTSLEKSQIPCGFSDLWVDLVSWGGRLGRLGQRPAAPTVGGI